MSNRQVNNHTPRPHQSNLDRHIEWLKVHHGQSSGAARNLRAAASDADSDFLREQKRKAADNAAANAAHYHELGVMLEGLKRLRVVLEHELADTNDIRHSTFDQRQLKCAAYERFKLAIDRSFGL